MGSEIYTHVRPLKKRLFVSAARLHKEVHIPRVTEGSDYQKVRQFPLRPQGKVCIEVPYYVRNDELNLQEFEIF